MARYFLLLILALHGFIHLMGFAKAFHYAALPQLTKEIAKPAGMLWLVAAALFLVSAAMMLWHKQWWPWGLAAVVLSQALIFSVWQDAKYGSLANAIILVAGVIAFGAWRFESVYQRDVQTALARNAASTSALLREDDIRHLPNPVQKYLRYVGVINKPKIKYVKVTFEGEMREKGKDWFPFVSEQYNFFDQPTRLFFMKAHMYGMIVPGYHAYKNGSATMQIKLFGLFPVVDIRAPLLNQAETVTVFNDMCLMAPATLIDKRIAWETIDSNSVKARFTANGIAITATLQFNESGQLVNFFSDDRTEISGMKQYRFSTPVQDYRELNGYQVISHAETIWHYPEGEFVYGKFTLKNIEYHEQ